MLRISPLILPSRRVSAVCDSRGGIPQICIGGQRLCRAKKEKIVSSVLRDVISTERPILAAILVAILMLHVSELGLHSVSAANPRVVERSRKHSSGRPQAAECNSRLDAALLVLPPAALLQPRLEALQSGFLPPQHLDISTVALSLSKLEHPPDVGNRPHHAPTKDGVRLRHLASHHLSNTSLACA